MVNFECLSLGKINVHDIGKPNLGIWGYGKPNIIDGVFRDCDHLNNQTDRCSITGLPCPLMAANLKGVNLSQGWSKFENKNAMAFINQTK